MAGARGALVAAYITVPSVYRRLPSMRWSLPSRSSVFTGWSNQFISGKKNSGATPANLLGTGFGEDLVGPYRYKNFN